MRLCAGLEMLDQLQVGRCSVCCWLVGHRGTQRDGRGAQTIPVRCIGVSS